MINILKRSKLFFIFVVSILFFFYTGVSVRAAGLDTKAQDYVSESSPVQESDAATSDMTNPILTNPDITLKTGAVTKLVIQNLMPDAMVSYEISDPEVSEIDDEGNIKALKEGTARITITVMQNNQIYELRASLTVYNTKIQFTKDSISLKIGETYQLEWELLPAGEKHTVSFASDNEDVAAVDSNGVITAKKAGNAIITAALSNGESASIKVTVSSRLKSVQVLYLSEKTITLGKGQSRKLYYMLNPSEALDTPMIWTSNNEKIATVDQNGKVTAKNTGTAVIILSANDGSGIKTAITVKVKKRGKKNTISESGLTIVDTSKSKYTYSEMKTDLELLRKKYGDCLTVKVAGKSYDNRNIYEVILGNPKARKKIFVQSSIHGREYMTALLTMKQIELYCKNYYTGMYNQKYYSELFDEVAFHIVPMANPDGVTISQKGAKGIRNKELRKKLEKMCKKYGYGKTSYYTYWKANARGVDLNRNFDAYWDLLKDGAKKPQAYNYKGPAKESEKETKVLVKLVNEINPLCTISYHATGSILYWNFGQKGTLKNKSVKLVNMVKSMTSYSKVLDFSKYRSTGFSDWVSIKKGLPAVTIEIGKSSCPLSIKEFADIWGENKMLYAKLADMF